MFNSIVAQILQLKIFLIVVAAGTLITGLVLALLCSNFSFTGKNHKIVGFFYGLSIFDSFGLAIAGLKFFLFVAILINKGNVEIIHIVVYGFLQVLYIIHRRSLDKLIYHILMGIVTAAIMVLMMILSNYLTEVVFNVKVLICLILMDIVLVLNSVGDIFRCVTIITTNGIKRMKGKNDGETVEGKTE